MTKICPDWEGWVSRRIIAALNFVLDAWDGRMACAALAATPAVDDCSCGGGDISGHDTLCPYARAGAATPAVGGEAIAAIDITGWKLVPDDPTEDMWQAGRSADIHPGDSYSKVWRAMFNAAPNVDDCETTSSAPTASPLRERKPDEWELAKFLCEKLALEDFDKMSRTKYLGDAKAVLEFLSASAPEGPRILAMTPELSDAAPDKER